jgi:hypothetical protein
MSGAVKGVAADDERNDAQMKPGKDGDEGPGGAGGAVAATAVEPEGEAGGQARQHEEAVWDQPIPWVASPEAAQEESAGKLETPQAEPTADTESPTVQADATRADDADDADVPAGAAPAPEEPPLRQSAPSEGVDGAHATPAPLRAGGNGGHAVSKRVLVVAAAAGGLLAVVGGIQGFSSHPSAATKKEATAPILPPVQGDDSSVTPTPDRTKPAATPAGKTTPKGAHAAPQPAARQLGARQPAAAPQSNDHVEEATQGRVAVKPPVTVMNSTVQQGAYLSVSTSVDADNPYWSQSTVTVTTKTKLTALKVVVRIHQTGGVASTGTWTSLGSQVTVHTGAGSQDVDYVVTLNAGITVNPGTYRFEFQYNHAQGTRGTGHDEYAVVATAPGSAGTESRQGHF